MIRSSVLLTILCGILGGCQTIGSLSGDYVSTDWASSLYDIETLAFRPQERGEALYVQDEFAGTDGLIIVPSKDRTVRALRASNGEELWQFETGGANIAKPVVVEEDVLIASTDGRIYRLNRRSGRQIWAVDVPGKASVLESPVVANGKIFLATMDNRVAALDASKGSVLWERKRAHHGVFTITGHAGLLIDGDAVITGFNDGWMVAFAISDGATLWSTDLSGDGKGFVDIDTTPIATESNYIVSSYGVGLFALNKESQDVAWYVKGEGFRTPVLAGTMLYATTASGVLYAIDSRTGKVTWQKKVAEALHNGPVPTRKYLLLPTSGGLLVIDRRSGVILSRVGDSHGFTARPVYVKGTLFALSNSGRLYALGIH